MLVGVTGSDRIPPVNSIVDSHSIKVRHSSQYAWDTAGVAG